MTIRAFDTEIFNLTYILLSTSSEVNYKIMKEIFILNLHFSILRGHYTKDFSLIFQRSCGNVEQRKLRFSIKRN